VISHGILLDRFSFAIRFAPSWCEPSSTAAFGNTDQLLLIGSRAAVT